MRARLRRLIREARRRQVLRVTAAYVGLFFVLAQAASIFFPALHLPGWSVTLVIALGILGLPVAIALAWTFDLTRAGVVRTPSTGSTTHDARTAAADAPVDDDRARWRRVQAVFSDALDHPPAGRAAFVAGAADGDAALRHEVESMLRAHESHGSLDRLSDELMAPLVSPLRSPGAAAPRRDDTAPARAGRYEVLERLAGGGMGVVHRGRDTRLQREVALKFLPLRADEPEARRRFIQEARAAAALEHPNICTIHEIGETADGGLFIAMPLYDGETLDRRLARGALPWEEALDVATQIASGLDSAHRAGIVHRDIKPANLCITERGVVKILDFGIAKVPSTTLTRRDAILGTAAYMSPEQARGLEVDARTDLWSLGAVLYEMLTGERLFRGEDRDAVLAGIRSPEPVPLGRLRGAAPSPVVRVVEHLLARAAGARPPSAQTVVSLLRDAVRDADQDGDGDPTTTTGELPPEGERRQATVLALAVAGYQGLLERLEPAVAEARLGRLRALVEEVVLRHGGTLNEFAGDRIVAVFGVPITHEDDALRAARAARELHELTRDPQEADVEGPLGLGAGIATGMLVAQPADRKGRTYRLAGEPPGAAVSLASRAASGETLMDPATTRGIGDAAGPQRLTTYTGRSRELESLLSSFEQALAGRGQVVTVVGEAGAGKSRLLHEFRARAGTGGARLLRGHCEAYTGSRPYEPFVEVLTEILGLPERGGPGRTEADVLAAARRLDPQLERFVPLFLHLLSVAVEAHPLPRHLQGEQFRAAMREALMAAITLASEQASLALLLEDWHWADEASGEVLKQLVEVAATFPILVVVAYRPDHGVDWESGQPRTLIQLAPLDVEDAGRILSDILDVTQLDPDMAPALHERAGGNPFFLEELCHSLREAGMIRVDDGRALLSGAPETLHLPTTIQGVIRTRLDRLPPPTREVVRAAAVLGREFSYPLLERMGHDRYALDRALQTLRSLGIVQQVRVVPERTFRFKHVLTQEVTYDTLLQHRRRVLHAQAGHAIEAVAGDSAEEHADRLAYHYSRAEDWLRAVRNGRLAARRARALAEFHEAMAMLDAVREWLSRLPEDDERRELEVETLLEQEELCETLGQRGRQQELLDRLGQLVTASSSPGRDIEVSRRQGDVYTLLGRFDEARRVLEHALERAREQGDRAAQGHVLRSLGLTGWHQGRPEEALEHIEEALRLDRQRGDEDAIIADLTNKAQVLKDLERYQEALDCLEQAAEGLERKPSDLKRSYVLHHIANIHRILGDPERALEYLTESVTLADRAHLPIQWSFHLTAIAHIRLSQGDVDEAVRTYEAAVGVARRARYAEGLAQSLRPLGELLAGTGRNAEALPYLREAAELFGQLGNPERETAMWRKTAETAEEAGDTGLALRAWERCRELARAAGDEASYQDALEGAARARRKQRDDPAAARALLMEALDHAAGRSERHREAAALNSLAILDWEQGAYLDAVQRYETALSIYRDLGDDVHAGVILNSLGVTLRAMGRLDDGRARLEEALHCHRASGQRLLEGHAHAALGEILLDGGHTDEALARFQASHAIRQELGDRRGEAWMSLAMARAHRLGGRQEAADERVAQASAIASELDDAELLDACTTARTIHLSQEA